MVDRNKCVKSLSVTDVERKELMEYVEETARERKQSIGKLDDADFFSGAMTMFFALGMEPPMGWVMGIMTSRPEMYGMTSKKRSRGNYTLRK